MKRYYDIYKSVTNIKIDMFPIRIELTILGLTEALYTDVYRAVVHETDALPNWLNYYSKAYKHVGHCVCYLIS